MPRPALFVAACVLLAGCAADAPSDDKAVADLRVELQRTQRENEKHREQIAVLERRLAGLAEDVSRVHKTSMDVAASIAPRTDAAAAAGSPGGGAVPPSDVAGLVASPAMKAYFDSEEGRKTIAAAVKAVQEQQQLEQTNRMLDGALGRLSKEANLTEDQTKKLKDILGRQATQMRELWQSAGGDMAERGQKMTELRTTTEDEVKAVLSQSQFETFQKTFPQGGGFGGFGGRGRGPTGAGGSKNGN